jgi:deoxycytidylate deaminase
MINTRVGALTIFAGFVAGGEGHWCSAIKEIHFSKSQSVRSAASGSAEDPSKRRSTFENLEMTSENTVECEENGDKASARQQCQHASCGQESVCDLLQREANYTVPKNSHLLKRQDYLCWEDYFMYIAFLSSLRSKDPHTQVGACIVNPLKRIVGIGYNGFPAGCSDDVLPWASSSCSSDAKWLHTKHPFECHAEMNAILNKCAGVQGGTIYVVHFPCE